VRLNLSPEIRWSSRGPGYFFEPAVGYDFTQYDLQDAGLGPPEHADAIVALCALGHWPCISEARSGLAGAAHSTLEPRLVYSFVPYRNQGEIAGIRQRTARS